MRILGGMSGSSLDGLDLALVEFVPTDLPTPTWTILAAATIPYERDLIDQLRQAPDLDARSLYLLDASYSHHVSDMIQDFLNEHGPADLIGCHGHTIYHDPQAHTSLQIGSGAVIAAHTGIDTLSQFRLMDLSLGGQGAPLAPLADLDLLTDYAYCTNLGGICNISHTHNGHLVAGDIAACNQLLNRLAQRLDLPYDDQGRIARSGSILPDLLSRLDAHPYHQLPCPKSMDNNQIRADWFPLIDAVPVADGLCTIIAHVAGQVARFVHEHPGGDRMILTGGGAHNHFLVERLRALAAPKGITIEVPDRLLVDAKEALLMAYMTYCHHVGYRNVLAAATGSARDHIGGYLHYGAHSHMSSMST